MINCVIYFMDGKEAKGIRALSICWRKVFSIEDAVELGHER